MKFIPAVLLCLSAAFGANAASACSITYYALSAQVTKSLKASGGFSAKNYDQVCTKLNKANAQLLINTQNGVANGRAVSYAYIMVMDRNLPIVNYRTMGGSAQLSQDATTARSEVLLAVAINEAIDNIDIDAAIEGLNQARKQVK